MKLFASILIGIALCFLNIQSSYGQEDKAAKTTPLHIGYHIYMNYNLYSWFQQGNPWANPNNGVGQVLNLLPGLGAGIWLGDVDRWTVAIEGGIEYLPFALDVDNYSGLGALSIPILSKAQFPIAKQKSLWLMLHAGAGLQFFTTDLYARPDNSPSNSSTWEASIIGELGIHITAVGYHKQHLKEIELFVRAGGFPTHTLSFTTGLRLTLWNKFGR